MNWLHKILTDKEFQTRLIDFLNEYGTDGLEQAMQAYKAMQQTYLCCTKASSERIPVQNIYYLAIHGHNIVVHTTHGNYKKYGSLNNELKTLSRHGFIKCNQSCIVSLSKIKAIHNNMLILTNNEKLPITRSYAHQVLMSFYKHSD